MKVSEIAALKKFIAIHVENDTVPTDNELMEVIGQIRDQEGLNKAVNLRFRGFCFICYLEEPKRYEEMPLGSITTDKISAGTILADKISSDYLNELNTGALDWNSVIRKPSL